VPDVLKAYSMRSTSHGAARLRLTGARRQQAIAALANAYNMDPLWRKDMDANRVLLLEPSHYNKYPVSNKVLDFVLSLSQNINGIAGLLRCGGRS
jgi:hypothetical protein